MLRRGPRSNGPERGTATHKSWRQAQCGGSICQLTVFVASCKPSKPRLLGYLSTGCGLSRECMHSQES